MRIQKFFGFLQRQGIIGVTIGVFIRILQFAGICADKALHSGKILCEIQGVFNMI